jgi:hypothetical protein
MTVSFVGIVVLHGDNQMCLRIGTMVIDMKKELKLWF